MQLNIHEELEKIVRAQTDPEAYEIGYALTEQLEQAPDAISAVPIILQFMEQHPNFDFGVPGPLVHFVEKFYRQGYEAMLCESFIRRPTVHTVFMLHRLANGSKGDLELKQKYVVLLEQASRRQDIDEDTRASALDYYQYHTKGK